MDFAAWIGREETATDTLHPGQARLMQATLYQAPTLGSGDILPSFWHNLYFNSEIPASQLKEDRHEQLGRFLQPGSPASSHLGRWTGQNCGTT